MVVSTKKKGGGALQRRDVSPQRMSLWKVLLLTAGANHPSTSHLWPTCPLVCEDPLFIFSILWLATFNLCCFSHWRTVVHGATQSEACPVGSMSCLSILTSIQGKWRCQKPSEGMIMILTVWLCIAEKQPRQRALFLLYSYILVGL